MKKLNLIIGALVLFILVAMTSCVAYPYGTYGTYDENDYYYIEGSPYYHTQHYYNDYYYDHGSPYYHHQHYYRDNNLEIQHNNRNVIHERSVVQPQRHDRATVQPNRDKRVVNNSRNERSSVKSNNYKNSKSVDTHKDNKNHKNK